MGDSVACENDAFVTAKLIGQKVAKGVVFFFEYKVSSIGYTYICESWSLYVVEFDAYVSLVTLSPFFRLRLE